MSTDLDVGLLLPCNVIVYEDGERSAIAILDPMSMLRVVENAELDSVAEEAKARLQRVIDALNA